MKLGVSYNLFDGEELLEGSINCIRSSVDYISVVYQTVSNFGNSSSGQITMLLQNLKERGLINDYLRFEPKLFNGYPNEILKRNLGLDLSRRAMCTHHMSMDTDEYYIQSEFNTMKLALANNKYDSSYCQMISYYKSWEYVLDPPEDYYVSLIFEIKKDSRYDHTSHCPVIVDPTRKLSPSDKPIVFDRNTIQMHHGSYIRNNIRTKLINSSAFFNFRRDINDLVKHYENWNYPEPAMWGGFPTRLHNTKKVVALF